MPCDQEGLQVVHDPQSAKLEAGTADGGLPEVVPYSDKEPVHSSVAADRSPQVIRKRRQKWIIIALVIFVVVAAAVGGGVGGALSARSNSASSQTDTSSPNSTATTPANASATACNNAGMQYAIYTNQPYVNDDTVFSKFRPGYFKTQKPFYNGTTNSIGLSVTTVPFFVQNISLYGSPTFNSSAFAVDHRAYLFAREAGTYIFTSNQADAVFYLWVGEENGAYTGWSNTTFALRNNYKGSPKTYKTTLGAGTYTPIRMLYANEKGAAQLEFNITRPNGNAILSATSTRDSPYFVQYSCDGTSAPEFQPWGQET